MPVGSYVHCARVHTRPSDEERHPHVKLEGKGFSFDEAELAEVVAMVGRVQDVGVVELAHIGELVVYALDGRVHALQRLQPLSHEQVRELAVDGSHLSRHLEDPLLVRVGRVVVGRRAAAEGAGHNVNRIQRGLRPTTPRRPRRTTQGDCTH